MKNGHTEYQEQNTSNDRSASQRDTDLVWNTQSFINIGYLLCSFFLSLIYFTLIVAGTLLGILTLILWIGIPILLVTVWLWWQCALFERNLAMRWLDITITPMDMVNKQTTGWWQDTRARLNKAMTWKTLLYLLVKFPLSAFCFVFAVMLPILCLCLAISGGVLGLITAPFFALISALQAKPNQGSRLRSYLQFFLSAFHLNLLYLHILNGMTWLHIQLACSLLGMSDTALRLEQAKIQAEQAEQRRHELVVNVSHELRAPVATIAGHLESLLLDIEENTEPPSPAILHNYLGIAYQETLRLSQLVDELLLLARMESDELSLNISEVAANEVVEEVYLILQPLARYERQITLVRGAQPHLPPVQADRQRLIQVLQNLVRNAIAYTPAGGIVSISLEKADEQHLALIVEDNGIGIPPDELEHIFGRFYRVKATQSTYTPATSTGGFGLGLAIVHSLVTAMGGSIDVKSVVGQGSRFCVQLKIAPESFNIPITRIHK